jgi:hypothetical protein
MLTQQRAQSRLMHSEQRGSLAPGVVIESTTDNTQGSAMQRAAYRAFKARHDGSGLWGCCGIVEIWHQCPLSFTVTS